MITSLTSFFVTFREGLEAILMTMLMLGVGRSQGVKASVLAIGILGGLAASAVLLAAIGAIGMPGDIVGEVMNAATALVLTYVVLLNARVSRHIHDHLNQVSNRGFWAMLLTIATIYFREGAEVVLMLYGPMASDPYSVIAGGFLGLVLVVAMVCLARKQVSRMVDNKTMFLISNIVLGMLAIYFYIETIEFIVDSGIITRILG